MNTKEAMGIECIGDKATLGCIKQINVGSSVYSPSSRRGLVLSRTPSVVCLWDVSSSDYERCIVIVDRGVVCDLWDANTS